MVVRVYGPADLRQAQAGVPVFSEDDLRRLITQRIVDGKRLVAVFAGDFTISRTLTIPSSCPGASIESTPGVTVSAATGADPAINIAAPLVNLSGIRLKATGSTGVGITVTGGGSFCLIDDCALLATDKAGGAFFSTGVSLPNTGTVQVVIRDCSFQTQLGVTGTALGTNVIRCRSATSDAFTATSPFCTLGAVPVFLENTGMGVSVSSPVPRAGGRIEGNACDVITVGSNCGSVAIVGNDGGTGGTITTTGGSGNNRLSANSGTWTKSLKTTDVDDDAPKGVLLRAPQVLTSGTSYSKPSGCNALIVEVVGAGGGGGGASSAASSAAAGAGGSAGGYARKYFDVSALAGPFTYAVGTGGSAGANTGGTGGTGGNSTFSDGTTTVTGGGGLGGNGMTAGTTVVYAQGKSGGTSSNGDVNARGQPGVPGVRHSGTVAASGGAGSGPFGGGGVARVTAAAGLAGNGPGSGGSGGCVLNGSAAVTGGAGADGVVVIWEFS